VTPQTIGTLLIALTALALLITGKVAPDIVALGVMVSLGITGLVDLPTLYSGFGSPVILTVVGMFIVSTALETTGVTAYVSRRLLAALQNAPETVTVGLVSLAAGIISLMMNTFASVALVAPIARQIAHRRNLSPSQLLMPVAFGALLGGMATLLTTSNLLLADLLAQRGLPTFGLLSFLPVGGPIALVGIGYLAWAAPRMRARRAPADQWSALQQARSELPKTYALSQRLFEAHVRPSSPLAGKTLVDSQLGRRYGATVAAIIRGKSVIAPPSPQTRIMADDWLLLGARSDDAATAGKELDLVVMERTSDRDEALFANETELAEIALPPHSVFVGQTLADIKFRERFGVNVLAIWREGRPWRSHLTEYRLQAGDGLLAQGSATQLGLLRRDTGFVVLTQLPETPVASGKALIAVGILAAFLLATGFHLLPVSLAALSAAILAVITGCVSIESARTSIRWQMIFLIGGMLPLAAAVENTGLTNIIGLWLPNLVGTLGSSATLFVVVIITALLTQVVSNTAATLIIGPLAISAAIQSHMNPEAMGMAVAIGASAAFLSPVAHPANLLVMSVGGYRFSDYTRLGLPLVGIAGIGAALLIPLFFPS